MLRKRMVSFTSSDNDSDMFSNSTRGRIRFNFIDKSDRTAKNRKFIKIVPESTLISNLPLICLRTNNDASMYDICINDYHIRDDDLDKPIKEFLTNQNLITFKLKIGVRLKFYLIQHINGVEIQYNPDEEANFIDTFLNELDIDPEDDKFFFYDLEGKRIRKFVDNFKEDDEFYVIDYPKEFDILKCQELFDKLGSFLNINNSFEMRHLLCMLYKIQENKEISSKLKTIFQNDENYHFSSISDLFLDSFNEKDHKMQREIFISFILSLSFIKDEKETYPQILERLLKSYNPFYVFDSENFFYKSEIKSETIIKINEVFGIYKGQSEKKGYFKYYDPYERKECEDSVQHTFFI